MSDSAQPVPEPQKSPFRVSMTVLALAMVCAAAATLGVVLLILAWSSRGSFVQRGTVEPKGEVRGIVFYESPYASPPQLTLTPVRDASTTTTGPPGPLYAKCTIVEQSELGFTWQGGAQNQGFRWEARGVKGGAADSLFVQRGSFRSVLGEQGEVHFAHAYTAPPNVELTGSRKTLVVECKATGFKWKNAGKEASDEGEVTWVAKGIKGK